MQQLPTPSVLRQWIARLGTFLCMAFFLSSGWAQTGELMAVKRPSELRSGPSSSHPMVAALAAQAQVTRQAGRQGPWVEVKDSANNTGWVHMFDLTGASASSGGNVATNALRGISSLFGGNRSASAQTGTSTVGIRGLRAQDLAASQPNINAVLMMETLRLDANTANSFAAEAQWQPQAVDALPAPPQPHPSGADPLRDRP